MQAGPVPCKLFAEAYEETHVLFPEYHGKVESRQPLSAAACGRRVPIARRRPAKLIVSTLRGSAPGRVREGDQPAFRHFKPVGPTHVAETLSLERVVPEYKSMILGELRKLLLLLKVRGAGLCTAS